MNDLEVFTPDPRIVTVRGLPPVAVLPIRVRYLAAFTKAILPILPYAQAGDFTSLVLHETDRAVQAISIGTGLERSVIDDLFPDDLVGLATAVFEVNLDFFARCILPQAQETARRINAVLGQTSSSASGAPDAPTVKH